MIRRRLPLFLCLAVAAFCGPSRAAENRPLELLRAMEERDYYDVAVDYLEFLKKTNDLPGDLAAIWDLEMAKCLRGVAATRAFDVRDFERLAAEAEKHLATFLKEHPDHPEVPNAMISGAMFSVDRALYHLREAKALGEKDPQQKAKHLTDARALLEESRPRFRQAIQRLQARIAALPPLPKREAAKSKRPTKEDETLRSALAERQRLGGDLLSAQFQVALVDYYIAQTYADPKAQPRTTALRSAAAAMDKLWQRLRLDAQLDVNPIGRYAHMWHGKIMEELGDYRTALDIYDEVLGGVPQPNDKEIDPAFEPLYAQVQQFAFAIMAREHQAQFLAEASQWLKDYAKRWHNYEGYQAVALEVAKTKLALAKKAGGAEKNRLTSEAVALLNMLRAIHGPYQREASELWQQSVPGGAAQAKTFDAALALGNAALDNGQWEEAAAAMQRAIELSAKVRDPDRVAEARNGLAKAKYGVAYQLFETRKWSEALKAAEDVAREYTATSVGPKAASLAMAAALNAFVTTPASETVNRQAALAKLERLAEFTEKTWPGKPEADDARIYRGQALEARGEFDKAVAVYDQVNPKSSRKPRALTLAASVHWRRYLAEKAKQVGPASPASQQPGKAGTAGSTAGMTPQDLVKLRARAVEEANEALAGMIRFAEPGKPLSPQHIDAQFLVAQMRFEAGQYKEAVPLLQPLVDSIRSPKPGSLDDNTVRICLIAVQSYLAIGDTGRAAEVGMVLADAGEDQPAVNAVLVQFVAMLNQERKKADAALIKATSEGNAKAIEEARSRLQSTQRMIGSVLKKLLGRKQFSTVGLLIVADAAGAVGLSAEARQIYNQVVGQAGVEPTYRTHALAQLVGLLREEGNFEEAFSRASQLVQDNPKVLAPLMERARVMNAWAEKDPAKLDDALAEWTQIRNLLEGAHPKPREYYEVVYNAAACLCQQALKDPGQSKQKAIQAAQWLKAAMLMNADLSGPDMVERYKALLEKLKPLLGNGPAAKAKV